MIQDFCSNRFQNEAKIDVFVPGNVHLFHLNFIFRLLVRFQGIYQARKAQNFDIKEKLIKF